MLMVCKHYDGLLTGSPLRSQSTVGAGFAVTSQKIVDVFPALGNWLSAALTHVIATVKYNYTNFNRWY